MEFSPDIKTIISDVLKTSPEAMANMSLEELEELRDKVEDLRHDYTMFELSKKLAGNGAYGASGNPGFYFYNVELAGDITGECRHLTQTMWHNMQEWFHETIWTRHDLWEQFNFALDESKHDWYRTQQVAVFSDTDSVYVSYGTFFECMTDEYRELYKSDRAKTEWILRYNTEFQNKLNTEWCEAIYKPRHATSIHEFELETISKSCIYLKKKKYIKGLVFNKGKFLDSPKVSGIGIEIIKSTTPQLSRKILTDMVKMLMFDYNVKDKGTFLNEFNKKLLKYRDEFMTAPVQDISSSVGIGNYKKYVIDDEEMLILEKRCPVSVHGIARYNHLAYKNNQKFLKTTSGKIKYYEIDAGQYFAFPQGELPEWAPMPNRTIQWDKTVIIPLNRFMTTMQLPDCEVGEAVQLELF